MAENKKSFILYADQIGLFSQLSDEEAGKLIKTIFEYVNDKNPVLKSLLLSIAFEPIKMQLKRDLKDWDAERKQRSEAGKLGGIASGISRRKNEAGEAKRSTASKHEAPLQHIENTGNSSNQRVKSVEANEANEADNVNVTVNVTDTVNVNDNVTVIKKEDIDSRKLKFASTLKPFTEIYGRDLIKEFYEHWTEPNKSNTKFRQELEKVWDLKKRLNTWSKNDKNFNKKDNGKPSKVEGYIKSANYILEKRGINPEDYLKQPDSD